MNGASCATITCFNGVRCSHSHFQYTRATSNKPIRFDDVGAIFSDKCLCECSRNESGRQKIHPDVHFPALVGRGARGVDGGWSLVLRNMYSIHTQLEEGHFHECSMGSKARRAGVASTQTQTHTARSLITATRAHLTSMCVYTSFTYTHTH